MPSKVDVPQDQLNERDVLIRGAAEALMADPEVGKAIAGVRTANFVQTARQAYKAQGFNFTDDDLRDIHEMLRELFVRRSFALKVN